MKATRVKSTERKENNMKYSATVMKWFPRHERTEHRRFWGNEKEEILDVFKVSGCKNIGIAEIEVVNNHAAMRVEFTTDARPDLEGMHEKIKKIQHAYGYSSSATIFGKWDGQMFVAQAVRVVNYDVCLRDKDF